MYQYRSLEDTIAAIATPPGQGGIGIVRLSGTQALTVAGRIFQMKNGKTIADAPTHTVHYGRIIHGDQMIDEGLITVMRAPKSYTTEDVVEVHCHGGMAAVRAVLEAALDAGARLAEPGEFTKRAFIHGRIDLAQAEAVLDIIQAKTQAFLRAGHAHLQGELSAALGKIRDALMEIYTTVEAFINFPEDDIDAKGRNVLAQQMKAQEQKIGHLVKSANQGRLLKEGLRIVLCGRPNVGKSSLLNVLLKHDRAIVTSMPGTTRDPLEEYAQIKGIPFQVIDTAGILEPRDIVEQEAVKRSRRHMEDADIVFLILDAAQPLSKEDTRLAGQIKDRTTIVVLNKSDLPARISSEDVQRLLPDSPAVRVSALRKTGIDDLESALITCAGQANHFDGQGILISNIRHVQALKFAQEHLAHAVTLTQQDTSWEFVSEEIKGAVNQLDAVTGRNIDADLLDRIFSTFCIGK
ncbi:MAG: tRNA uridine-5-carboxymethylaminomethyl(34) synthesis GTPase MnmE [Candidatus Omnitrophica bacterium]|nr:tRNA uridine-5-carboxymethylaminomethyl(34) synthesis GTPase MnmE [Candidatus Omnitrophota bacterium]